MLYWIGLLDTLLGVILVLVAFELPFAIFIMKGFFDAVPWDIEMSALTDGASRRQAFLRVVLPQVRNGTLAISVFTFIRGWEEYIFVFTFLVLPFRQFNAFAGSVALAVIMVPVILRTTDETLEKFEDRVLMFSTVVHPTATVYPDSDKVGIWVGDPEVDMTVRRSAKVGYYDNEPGTD